MSIVPYTKKVLVERIKIHMANNYPNSDMSLSDNQVLLYIDQALAFNLVGQVYNMAKLEGTLVMPEAYISTYNLPSLTQDPITGYWSTILPQPPISLPLGYSITDVYFAKNAFGKSDPILPIKNKRVSYRNFMPIPNGTRYWVEGNILWLATSNNQPLLEVKDNVYAKMAKTRTDDINETMDLPDDHIENIFNNVVLKCKDRMQIPQDIIKDNLPAGNKSS